MRVLLLGATGNLGPRLIPAVLAHGHVVIAYVRSPEKLRGLVSPSLLPLITVVTGDATDSASVKEALLIHDCDAIVNAAGNIVWPWREQILGKIAAAVSKAAIEVGNARGKPLRAWFMGVMTSLTYLGTGGYKIEDYLPAIITMHGRPTAAVLDAIPTSDLEWSLLCVTKMVPVSKDITPLTSPRTHDLDSAIGSPPSWNTHFVRSVPFIGAFLNLLVQVPAYMTKLEEVADFISEDLEKSTDEFVGQKVGLKGRAKEKAL